MKLVGFSLFIFIILDDSVLVLFKDDKYLDFDSSCLYSFSSFYENGFKNTSSNEPFSDGVKIFSL